MCLALASSPMDKALFSIAIPGAQIKVPGPDPADVGQPPDLYFWQAVPEVPWVKVSTTAWEFELCIYQCGWMIMRTRPASNRS